MPIRFGDPSFHLFGVLRAGDAESLPLAKEADIVFPHPEIRGRADGIRGQVFRNGQQRLSLQGVFVPGRGPDLGEGQRVTGTRRSPIFKFLQRQGCRLVLSFHLGGITEHFPDVLVHDAVNVLAGIVANVAVPRPIVPDKPSSKVNRHGCPPGVSPRSITRRTFDGSLPRVIFWTNSSNRA